MTKESTSDETDRDLRAETETLIQQNLTEVPFRAARVNPIVVRDGYPRYEITSRKMIGRLSGRSIIVG
jgi:hypothetical protein